MILNEFEAVTNSANGPIIFTYYAESALSRSSLQYVWSVMYVPSRHEYKLNGTNLVTFSPKCCGNLTFQVKIDKMYVSSQHFRKMSGTLPAKPMNSSDYAK